MNLSDQALIDSIKGPCLLDLADLMQTSVEKLSDIFVISIKIEALGASPSQPSPLTEDQISLT